MYPYNFQVDLEDVSYLELRVVHLNFQVSSVIVIYCLVGENERWVKVLLKTDFDLPVGVSFTPLYSGR